jgi:hypothetical protein
MRTLAGPMAQPGKFTGFGAKQRGNPPFQAAPFSVAMNFRRS